jgi:hypothetical protein
MVAEIIGKIPKKCRKFGKARMWIRVNFGAQEFGEGISRIQGILENVNMPCHDMQPNALLIWPKFITAKSGC